MDCNELAQWMRQVEERLIKLEGSRKKPAVKKPKGAIGFLNKDAQMKWLLENVSQDLQTTWVDLYGDNAWIILEVKKAYAWVLANPGRAPRANFGRFYNSWLARSWERQRKTTTSTTKKLDF